MAFNLQQQVGDPPDFPKVGILHSPHEPRVGMGGRDFRGALTSGCSVNMVIVFVNTQMADTMPQASADLL